MTSTHRTYDHAPQLHDKGLSFDVRTLLNRRSFGIVAGAGMLTLAGCAAVGTSTTSSSSGTPPEPPSGSSPGGGGGTTSGTTGGIPNETAGPYPGDGSNGPDVLLEDGIIRSDITRSFGTATGSADGVPLTTKLTLVDNAAGGTPVVGAAVYLWHCDQNGEYSLYSSGLENENYLRGVQETDATGTATFVSIFPAAYSGRWPHIHFEIYSSLAEATASGQIFATSQIALPEDASRAVYQDSRYPQSASNLDRVSLATDNVFSDDGGVSQLATMTGSATSGYTASLTLSTT